MYRCDELTIGHLKGILVAGGSHERGICSGIWKMLGRAGVSDEDVDCYISVCRLPGGTRIGKLFEEWPEFSGNLAYPVHGVDGWDSEGAYDVLDHWSGEYGAARMRLVVYLIGRLEESVNGSV